MKKKHSQQSLGIIDISNTILGSIHLFVVFVRKVTVSSTTTTCMWEHMRGVVMHAIIVVKCSKQNMENDITNTPDFTGSDVTNVKKDSMKNLLTSDIIVHSFMVGANCCKNTFVYSAHPGSIV